MVVGRVKRERGLHAVEHERMFVCQGIKKGAPEGTPNRARGGSGYARTLCTVPSVSTLVTTWSVVAFLPL
jgi:hypothetical protein